MDAQSLNLLNTLFISKRVRSYIFFLLAFRSSLLRKISASLESLVEIHPVLTCAKCMIPTTLYIDILCSFMSPDRSRRETFGVKIFFFRKIRALDLNNKCVYSEPITSRTYFRRSNTTHRARHACISVLTARTLRNCTDSNPVCSESKRTVKKFDVFRS